MARLNLTLDEGTLAALRGDARREHRRVATHARELLREAMVRRQQERRARTWAEAYRADRADATALARDLEPGALELMGDEDA
jgi:uncharacterized membrane protein